MNPFRRKSSQRVDTGGRNPLAAIPLIPAGVQHGVDDLALVQVRREHQPRSRIAKATSRWLGQRYSRRTRLDERGSFFWQQIDGHRTLREIADRMSERFGLSPHDGRRASMVFTRMLMLRNLIAVKIDVRRTK